MQNQSPNDITLDVYNRNIELYLLHTPQEYGEQHKRHLNWIELALNNIPNKGTILEIGSGHGRDARYFLGRGYEIQCSDGAQAFVEHLNSQGLNAILFNPLKDRLDKKFDMIFANSVIPHFTPKELVIVLQNLQTNLKRGGILAFNAKQGHGETWINEKFTEKRYVHYWSVSSLEQKIEACGFKVLSCEAGISGGDIPSHSWVQITAQS